MSDGSQQPEALSVRLIGPPFGAARASVLAASAGPAGLPPGTAPVPAFPVHGSSRAAGSGSGRAGGAEEAPPWACSIESLGSGNAGHLGMPGPRSVPGAPLGEMKQQPLLSARVKCDRKIGEAAGGGGGGAQLGSAGRGVPWQRGFRPHPPTPHLHHQAPGADVLGSRGEVVIPTQPLPERARTGPRGIAQTQFSMILRALSQPKGSTGQSGQAAQRRWQSQGCRVASGVQPCVLWRREDGSSGPGIQLQRGASECQGEGAAL